jgi:hypothetical protein
MPKLTQSQIKANVDEWAKLDEKIQKATETMNSALEPFYRKHALAIQPVLDEHEPKIQKLFDKKASLEAAVISWLNEQKKPLAISGELAVAANETKLGSRVIDPVKFFVVAKEKGQAAWECVTVAIAKAEKLLGKKTVDEISSKDSKLVPSLKRK